MTKYYSGKKLYRSRNGMFFGVCQGLADWRDLPVMYIRLALVIILFVTGVFPIVLLYLLAGLIIPMEPLEGGFRDAGQGYQDPDMNFKKEKDNRFAEEKERDWDKRFFDND